MSAKRARTMNAGVGNGGGPRFVMLGDQPATHDEDLLGFTGLAEELAALILSSRGSTPLTLGIDAGWGMGKSSLLNLLQERLRLTKAVNARQRTADGSARRPAPVKVIEFNPWSAGDGQVLEGLTKRILREVEPQLRTVLRSSRTRKGLKAATQLAGHAVDTALLPLPVPNLGSGVVNALWALVEKDPVARNQLRLTVRETMHQWLVGDPERLLCVFIDDLDRCSPKAVFELFEAMKVHLDAPGLVYVVAYYGDVISKEIFKAEGYPEGVTSREYLEKIIQTIYRLPMKETESRAGLVDAYLAVSRTEPLVGHLRAQLGAWSEGNPRRLKRIINTAIVACDPEAPEEERAKTLAQEVLATYYPELLETGVKGERRREEFVAYSIVRPILARDVEPEELDPSIRDVRDWAMTHWDLPRGRSGPELLQALDALVGDFITLVWDPRLTSLVASIAPSIVAESMESAEDVGNGIRDWRSEVPDESARRVLAALLNPKHGFRTVEGLADEAAVDEEDVKDILGRFPQFVRQSASPDKRGRPLFAARPSLKQAATPAEAP